MQRSTVMTCVLVILLGLGAGARGDQGQADAVKARLAKEIDSASKASAKLQAFAKEKLLPLCTNGVFVREVKVQNAKKATLAEIQAIDKKWTDAEDELPVQKEKLNNPCAAEANRLVGELGVATELFVMDNQGANVGQNEMTSDYWQGDEPKWTKSYNDGKGGVDISEVKFDKSANSEDQKVSLPIIDESGNVIGAFCVGLKPDKI